MNMRSHGFPRALVFPVMVLVVWEILAHFGPANGSMIVPIERVFYAAYASATDGTLAADVGWTLARVISGFIAGGVSGLVVGYILGTSRLADYLVSPTLNAMRQVPLTGWIPVAALLFGLGEGAKLSLIALAAFYPVALNTAEGFASVSPSYCELGRSLNFNRVTTWKQILLPAATPQILTGVKHGIAFAWIAAVAAELLLTSGPGLGSMIETGRTLFRFDVVILGVALIGACGYVMTIAVGRVERGLLRWRN